MRLFVTGGSGFTGLRVVRLLVDIGHDVVAMGRSAEARHSVADAGAVPVAADLDRPETVRAAMEQSGAEVLVNVASMGFGHAPDVIRAAEAAGIERAVFVSTTAIFTKLAAPSKAVRVAAEEAVRASTMRTTILRPTMIYGAPGDRNMERLVRFVQRSPVVPVPGRGSQLQQPVHVDDLAAGIVAAALAEELPSDAYDLPGPTPLPFRDVVRQTAGALDRRVRLLTIPLAPVRFALTAYNRSSSTPRLSVEQLDRLQEDKVFDPAPAIRDLGWTTRSFDVGIAQLVADLGKVASRAGDA